MISHIPVMTHPVNYTFFVVTVVKTYFIFDCRVRTTQSGRVSYFGLLMSMTHAPESSAGFLPPVGLSGPVSGACVVSPVKSVC